MRSGLVSRCTSSRKDDAANRIFNDLYLKRRFCKPPFPEQHCSRHFASLCTAALVLAMDPEQLLFLRQHHLQGTRFRSSSSLLRERLHLAPMAEAVDQILAGAHREQVDAGEPEAPQHVGEAQLIPGREPHHLVEPEAHEEVRRGGVIPHNGRSFCQSFLPVESFVIWNAILSVLIQLYFNFFWGCFVFPNNRVTLVIQAAPSSMFR